MFKLEYLIILLLATIFLSLFVKNKSKIGSFFHVLDIPTEGKIHKKTTPLIGSFPIMILSLVIIIYFGFTKKDYDSTYIIIYSYVFFIVGYLDDRYGLNAYLKLGISTIIIFLAINSVDFLMINKIYIKSLDKIVFLYNVKLFFTILCILLLINALNLMDGINGLASGFASAWMLSLSLISNNEIIFGLLFILSIFTFIVTFQIIRGDYFLGDSGTLFLGCLVGLFTLYIYNNQLVNGNFIEVEKIFIFFMIPGIDMLRLFLARITKKKDPFSRDLNHLHHLMLRKFTLYQTLIIYLLMFSTTNFLSYFNKVDAYLIIFIYSIIYIFFIFFSKKKFNQTSN